MEAYLWELKLFALLLLANGSPIVAARLFGHRFELPVDGGIDFLGRPLLGTSKTWRGILAAVFVTTLFAPLLGLPWQTGTLIGVGAMAGDLLASFIKRRLGIIASGISLGLDQIPESFLPLLLVRQVYGLEWTTLLVMTGVFFIAELILSRIGYRLKIRKHPY